MLKIKDKAGKTKFVLKDDDEEPLIIELAEGDEIVNEDDEDEDQKEKE